MELIGRHLRQKVKIFKIKIILKILLLYMESFEHLLPGNVLILGEKNKELKLDSKVRKNLRNGDIFYNKEACINCHILNAADGGNNQLSKEHVVNIVTNGYGVMPAYKDKLSEKEIDAVATFVSKEGKNWKNKLSSFVQ